MSDENLKKHEEEMILEDEVGRLLEVYKLFLEPFHPGMFNVNLNISNNRRHPEVLVEEKQEEFGESPVKLFQVTMGEDGKFKLWKSEKFTNQGLINAVELVLEEQQNKK